MVALTWGGYPLIVRASGVGGPTGAFVLTICALLPIVIAATVGNAWIKPNSSELVRLIAAGILMGVGTAAFNYIVNSRHLDASISIPIIDTSMLVVSVIGAILFFAEPITLKKILGVALLVAGIVVLKPV